MTEIAKILAKYVSPLNLNTDKAEIAVYTACLAGVLALAS